MNKIKESLEHTTDTKYLLLEPGAVHKTGETFARLFPGRKAVVVADRNTWAVAGKDVQASLEAAGVQTMPPLVFTDPDLYAEWRFVQRLTSHLQPLDAIAVAVGSGVINDLTKYVSGTLGRRYMCVGTAASMDGFTAYGASITKDGNKQTFSCPAPFAFVMDPVIAAAAPKELAASGYADLVAKIPAGADWMLADALGVEKLDGFSFGLVQNGLRESLSRPDNVRRGDVADTAALCEGLLMSGFAMQTLQSSRPASGTEHQFSHFWDMENLSGPDGKHVSHGFKVGIGTLVSTAVWEYLLSKDIALIDIDSCTALWKSWEETQDELRRAFSGRPGHLSRALEETEGKYVDAAGLKTQLETFKAVWPELKEKVRERLIPFDELYDDLKKVGAPYEPEMIFVSRERLRDTFRLIPYMRSRFTAIDIVFRLGLMDELEKLLFGKGGHWEI